MSSCCCIRAFAFMILVVMISAESHSLSLSYGKASTAEKMTVRKGDKVEIKLESNPTTGYTWTVQSLGAGSHLSHICTRA
mmetsp:Transcript_38801/g.60483  ORF Transcript_38801/g.60483 Transcript_38801/m.60483 type:complete len:80 (+) Transcript_38801:247-486(+)